MKMGLKPGFAVTYKNRLLKQAAIKIQQSAN
jgi:hypothetical protein